MDFQEKRGADLNPEGYDPPMEGNMHVCASVIEPCGGGTGGTLMLLLHSVAVDSTGKKVAELAAEVALSLN